MALDVTELFLSSWGDIQLFVSKIEWDDGETQVVHDLAAGDEHPMQPRGSHLKKASVTLLFDDFDGAKESGISAFRRFKATSKERRIFTHPVSGSYFARIGDLKPSMDENSVITATCEFIPDAVFSPVSPSGAGTGGTSGESSVNAAADVTTKKLADIGIGFEPTVVSRFDFTKPVLVSVSKAFKVLSATAAFSSNLSPQAATSALNANVTNALTFTAASVSVIAAATASNLAFAAVYLSALSAADNSSAAETSGMPSSGAFAFAYACAAVDTDARVSVASWSDEDEVPTRKIMIDTARLSESIASMIEAGGFEHDIQLFPAFRAAIMLGESIRSAAIAATSETPSVFVLRVQRSTSLVSLAARVYGGTDAQARARQIQGLNDIRTPGWLDPGDYLAPSLPASSTSPLLGDEEV